MYFFLKLFSAFPFSTCCIILEIQTEPKYIYLGISKTSIITYLGLMKGVLK